ncbi:3alpha(or 20beta)-hydroxysteroid dehydrogenase [Saccharopolyspora shandongensis]|uniref:3alpha(Or 20beta)-hydroxysteroid dehydrogenase n=1 Tax=Saccharopolyspora shandongensis TaxID=418495 RepID=A0A1H3E8H2_9PSEU|nr:glucose 1-dehydrogenase [Saccharopolyspora shandongensis]SDX74214.1 3alpha(or 20beta)-hydroxysteroid dehydrogenase [Saccharopolyspora shandongensis]
MGRLDGKVAITGAAQGLGAATARLFAAEGAAVVLGDVLVDAGRQVADEIGPQAMFQQIDVRDEADWRALVAAAADRFGGIDILVNNAGILHWAEIEELSVADAQQVLDINVLGVLLGVKAVVPTMKAVGRGVVVNISSVDGLRDVSGLAAYSASKWAVRGLSRSLAYELGPSGIRVCTIHPGGVDTAMGNPADESDEELQRHYVDVPLQRIDEPDEIAQVALFVASDAASYLSGVELAVDGGWSAGTYYPTLPGAPDGVRARRRSGPRFAQRCILASR